MRYLECDPESETLDVTLNFPSLPPPQSWNVLVSQTESLSKIMRKRSEDLLVGPLSKLTLLIRDKQQLRKSYSEQWTQLNQDLCRVSSIDTHTHTPRTHTDLSPFLV